LQPQALARWQPGFVTEWVGDLEQPDSEQRSAINPAAQFWKPSPADECTGNSVAEF